MKTWSKLKAGDIVDVIAPGSSSSSLDVAKSIEFLKAWDLTPRVCIIDSKHPFHCGEDEERLALLQKAIYAKDSKAIMCMRGGYGCNRLMPELLKIKTPKFNKLLIGYSDITTLHLLFSQKWKWVSCHGPLLDTFINGKLDSKQTHEARDLLFGKIKSSEFKIEPLNEAARKAKTIKAPAIGGNLVVLASSLGTDYQLSTKGKILFLEEVGERGYRIDRDLEHLRQVGALAGCRAVVFGEFLGGNESDQKNYVQFAIERFAAQTKIPCFNGLEVGHGHKNRMLFLGTATELLSSKGIWRVASGVKR